MTARDACRGLAMPEERAVPTPDLDVQSVLGAVEPGIQTIHSEVEPRIRPSRTQLDCHPALLHLDYLPREIAGIATDPAQPCKRRVLDKLGHQPALAFVRSPTYPFSTTFTPGADAP